jgi:hypothetical protein
MAASLSLKEEVDLLVQDEYIRPSKKLNRRFDKSRELSFKDLKSILTKFSKEYLFDNYFKNGLFDKLGQ